MNDIVIITDEQVEMIRHYYLQDLPLPAQASNDIFRLLGKIDSMRSESQAAPGKVVADTYCEENIVIQCECCKAEIIGYVVRPGKYQYQCAKFCINSEAGNVVAGDFCRDVPTDSGWHLIEYNGGEKIEVAYFHKGTGGFYMIGTDELWKPDHKCIKHWSREPFQLIAAATQPQKGKG